MPHRVVIAAFAPAQLLDISGPMDVFSVANELRQAEGHAAAYELVLAAPEAGLLATSCGVALHARLRSLCERVPRVGSICTGAFVLAATGLLDGARATTHWAHFDELAACHPRVRIERDALFVANGRYHSSAGVTAGIDYALALVERDHGRALALAVARQLVVFLRRPGGQAQFSAELAAESPASEPERFAALTRWMAGHLQADLSVDALAGRCAMSQRHFARRFAQAMNVAPGKYVQALRVDAARRLLSGTALPLAHIAERCGFRSDEAMRQCFQRHLEIAPKEFRARFRGVGSGA